MTATTFDGATLPNATLVNNPHTASFTETQLNSGKVYLQGGTAVSTKWTFKCHTGTYSEVSAIIAKIGTKGSLVYAGVTYTNCMIVPPVDENPNKLWIYWEPVVTIARQTV